MAKLISRALFLLLLALVLALALPGCRREVVAPGDPVAAVKGLAKALRDNDLVRYSRLSMPPELHQRVEQRWRERLVAGKPPTEAQQRDYARWMGRLTAADAEAKLYAQFDKRLGKIEKEMGAQWPLMQATGGIFLNGLIKANNKLSRSEKEHARAVGTALLAWLSPELLADRNRARQAIAVLSSSARELELPTLADTRKLEMIPTLEKGGELMKALKQVARIYGLDADDSLSNVQARVLAASGDTATMEVTYPLLGKPVRFQMELLRRKGRWYPADAVREAEADLLRPVSTAVAP